MRDRIQTARDLKTLYIHKVKSENEDFFFN